MLPENLDDELKKLLIKMGVRPGFLYKIRFGGVIGKIALISFVGIAVIGAIALKTSDAMLHWGCLGACCLLVMIATAAILFYGNKHPHEATLEGSEVVAMQQLRNDVAAKGRPEVEDQPAIEMRIGTKAIGAPKDGPQS